MPFDKRLKPLLIPALMVPCLAILIIAINYYEVAPNATPVRGTIDHEEEESEVMLSFEPLPTNNADDDPKTRFVALGTAIFDYHHAMTARAIVERLYDDINEQNMSVEEARLRLNELIGHAATNGLDQNELRKWARQIMRSSDPLGTMPYVPTDTRTKIIAKAALEDKCNDADIYEASCVMEKSIAFAAYKIAPDQTTGPISVSQALSVTREALRTMPAYSAEVDRILFRQYLNDDYLLVYEDSTAEMFHPNIACQFNDQECIARVNELRSQLRAIFAEGASP